MQKFSKKILYAITFLTIIFLGSFYGTKYLSADNDDSYLRIKYASYGDYDSDGIEDDIYSYSKMGIDYEGNIETNFALKITLPSGISYDFSYKTSLEIDDDDDNTIRIKITVFDIATEKGWYTVDLTCYYSGWGIFGVLCASKTFDPPTDTGPGEPTAEFDIIT
ncbi:MAG: hypothetical protein GF308_06440 [Candidatus Heimdallarchaeota archaeon]|nr:hypothetical protein [Candidatus Heimdallarchaeota archaeon]